MTKREDEKVFNPFSTAIVIAAIIAGVVLVALGFPLEAGIPFALALGVAGLPQPIRGDQ